MAAVDARSLSEGGHPPLGTRPRDTSIDLLRGIVMVLMVLDHARDFFTSRSGSPTDPATASGVLFFTRFVTHYCAPVFVALAGAGAGISRARGKPVPDLVRFLVTRGLWLVLLELTLVRFGWQFDLSYHRTGAQVIWALGWSMVLLGVLVPLGPRVLAALGAVIVLGHDLVTPIPAERFGVLAPLWRIAFNPGPIAIDENHSLYIAYAVVPWLGVMLLGYALGHAWTRVHKRHLCYGGAAALVAFVALRGLANGYGDPTPWVAQATTPRTLLAILACEKYPPSLDYLLVTLGPAAIALGALHGRKLADPLSRALVVFGQVPLFFYLLHLPLVHALSLPLRAQAMLPLASGPFRHGLDVSLPLVYAMWALTVAILWMPCRAWARLKARSRAVWLSYL